jgi:hypothetical protein
MFSPTVTIAGVNILEPGQFKKNTRITFDYGNGVADSCVLQSFGGSQIICKIPAGQGKPTIVVNICGQVQRSLPRYVYVHICYV